MSNQVGFKELQVFPSVFLSEDVVSILGIASEITPKLTQAGEGFLGSLITGVVMDGMMKVTV